MREPRKWMELVSWDEPGQTVEGVWEGITEPGDVTLGMVLKEGGEKVVFPLCGSLNRLANIDGEPSLVQGALVKIVYRGAESKDQRAFNVYLAN